ncbi:hypothetical protein GGI35DRAFT_464867 [Trichoderma velutinum]
MATILSYYKEVLQQYQILNQHSAVEYPAGEVPENDNDLNDLSEEQKKLEETKRSIPKLRASLKAWLILYHYPSNWTIPDAAHYQKLFPKTANVDSNLKNPTADWVSIRGEKGERVFAVRRHGEIGLRVLLEIEENGRLICRLEAALRCGISLSDVKKFSENPDSYKLTAER